MRVLYDGVSVEGCSIVHLEDGGELVGVHQVDDGDGEAHQAAAGPGDQHQPEAPSQLKVQHNLVDVNLILGARKTQLVNVVIEQFHKMSWVYLNTRCSNI